MVQQEEQIVQQFSQQNVSEQQQQFNQAIVRELAIAIKVGSLQKIPNDKLLLGDEMINMTI